MSNRLYSFAAAAVLAAACGVALGADSAADAAKPGASKPAPVAPAGDDEMMMSDGGAKDAKQPVGGVHVKLTKEQTAFFEAKVRPVLAANCYECHSVEHGKAKGGLALDTRDGLLKGGSGGTVLVPGDPAKSRLITAISYTDPDLEMPPKGDKLSAKEVADLTEWVKMGAPDPRVTGAGGSKLTGLTDKAKAHWAYQPVKSPRVPEVRSASWVRTPVDSFVLARLEQNEMKPSPQAAKEALIRRATFDLTGLPPTPEEVRAFAQDQSPNAFERVVDRLLSSPHYGERWGRFWLDTARYSDTTGAEQNNRREDYRYPYAWTYRDYVIKAFNEDRPYDQFLKEQIAADLMPETAKDPHRLAGLGFLTVGKRFQNPNDTIDERIDTLTKATLASTVSCARCHDHKFDPVPTADYYSLHGIFVSTVEPSEKPMIGAPPGGGDYADFMAKMADLEQRNRDIYFNYVQNKGSEFRSKASAYLQVGMNYRRNTDRDAILSRNRLIQDHKLDRDLYQGLRINRREDSVFGPLLMFAQLDADKFENRAPDVLRMVKSGRIARRPINPLVVAAFKDVEPSALKSFKDVANVYGALFKDIAPQADAYVRACRTAKTATIPGFTSDLVELINFPAAAEPAAVLDSEHLKQAAARLPQQNSNAYQRFQFAAINELQLTHPGAPARAMVVADAPVPRNSFVFIRGEAQNRGPIAPRQFLEVLSGKDRKPFTQGSGRLELANAIATKDNPLTARVAVNRIWLHHFGEGLVRTPDDLGVQSEPPSHPELLDYLASQFVENGWSFKKMHKLIMLSATYQQSSDTVPAYAQKDPDNRLLWRANLRRIDFEAMRDSMLQFTGKLDRTLGGKPVNLTEEPYSNRRSVYGYVDRGDVPELMEQFDFADPDMANSKRTTTIVPQQALFLMNSPMSVDVARKVTSRPEFTSAQDDAGRVRAIYQVLFQRMPRPEEVKFAAEFYNAKVIADRRIASSGAPATPKEQIAQETRRKRLNKQLQQKAANQGGGNRNNGKQPVRNEGEIVERKPLTVWEEYAQALLFTNEIAYIN